MPAFCSHYLFFRDSEKFIKLAADFELNESVCSLGSQGADIFFFHKIYSPFRSLRKTGSALHRAKPEDILNAFAQYIKKNPDPVAKSYAYGFILHYALDRRCHPYVYALEKKITDRDKKTHRASAHNRVEAELDAYMLHLKLNEKHPYMFDSYKTISLTDDEKNEVAKLLCYTVKRVLKKKIRKSSVIKAIDDTTKVQKILQDRSGRLCAVSTAAENIFGSLIGYYKISAMIKPRLWKNSEKYANINNGAWVNPFSGETSYLSFEQLYIYALQEAQELIVGFEQKLENNPNADNITNNLSFLTGLEIK